MWLVQLHSGNAIDDDWARYEAWKNTSSVHSAAAAHAEQLWERLGKGLKPPQRRIVKGAIIGLALCGVLVGLAVGSGAFGPLAAYFADERTNIGERRSVTLRDGSVVDLDSATSFDVDFSATRRRLVLYSGQIYVAVKPNPSRPFLVETLGGTTRALGTAFDVETLDDIARVTVTQHKVRVSYPDDGPSVELPTGQQVDYAPATGLTKPRLVDVSRLTAWRHGQMIFENRPLAEVVRELSRYHRGKIIITDATLGGLLLTGVFDTKDADGLLGAIAATLPVRVIRLPWLTIIQPASNYAAASPPH